MQNKAILPALLDLWEHVLLLAATAGDGTRDQELKALTVLP